MDGASKVIIEEEPPRVRGIPSAPTSVVGAVGIAERGPVATPVLVTSFDEHELHFGGFTAKGDLALAAASFFENGGSQLWVARTVHFADAADQDSATARRSSGDALGSGGAASAEVMGAALPLALEDGDELVLSVGGGADVAVRFEGLPATVLAGGAAPFALADGQALTIRVDGGREQTVLFEAADFADITRAQPHEVAAVLNAKLAHAKALVDAGTLELQSDTRGTRSRVEVTGGDANTALDFPTAAAPGLGDVADLAEVTLEEILAQLGAVTTDVVALELGGQLRLRTVSEGASASLQVRASTSPRIGLDTDLHRGSDSAAVPVLRIEGRDPGAYADRLEVVIGQPIEPVPAGFSLAVREEGTTRELFGTLSMEPTHPLYAELIVNDARNGSTLIRVDDLRPPGPAEPTPQTVRLAGGDDGLVGLSDVDFVGSPAGQTGLHALDSVADLSILIVPGRATPAVHQAMVAYCEIDRSGFVFAVLDPPAGASATDMVTYVERTARLLNLSEHAAIYWPRVLVLNRDRTALGPDPLIVAPPSGVVAGVYARTDASREGGVYDPPAGVEVGRLFGVLGFETREVLDERKRDLVFPKRINPLTATTLRYIDGARTLKGDGNFPYVSERRGVSFIERSLKAGLQFARHRNHDERLRAEVRRTITSFLLTQMELGAFRSRNPATAFFVDVSEALNTPRVVFSGRLIARVGLATQKPAEFVILRLSQDTRQLEAELATDT